jgi:very-short-patch-repair endonuclease
MGKPLSEETKRKISEARKGKGHPHTEESIRKIREAQIGIPKKGHPHTEEHKAYMREVMKGKNVGKVHSEEQNRKASEANKGRKFSEETLQKRSKKLKGRVIAEETRQKISETKRGAKQSEETKQKRRETMQQVRDTPEYRAKLSEGVKKAYENPEFREKQREMSTSPERSAKFQEGRAKHIFTDEEREVKRKQMLERWEKDDGTMLEKVRINQPSAAIASQLANPSSLEIQVKGLLDVLGIHYEQQKPIGIYTADFFLPDRNLILEIYGCYWHACPACGYEYPKKNGYDKRREAYIRACGYNVFILWEHDLKNDFDINSII